MDTRGYADRLGAEAASGAMKVLFIGLGGIGQRHLRNLRSIVGESLEVIAYRSRNLSQAINNQLEIEPGVNVNERFDIEVYDSLPKALEQKPDAAFICNPTSMHVPAAIEVAQAGCNLFIEKALSHSLDGIHELVQIIEDKRLTCMVGYQMRFHPCMTVLQNIIRNRLVGRVLAVNAEVGEYMPGWHKYEDYRDLYAARSDLGGGVIVSQVHELDYIQWLFGFPRRVFATGGQLSTLEVNVEDVASIIMECQEDGRLLPVHLHQDFVQRPASRTCRVIGDKGKAIVDFLALTVIHYADDGSVAGEWDFAGFERNQLFVDEMRHFVDCIETGTDPRITVRDGLQSVLVMAAAKESMATGRVITLGESQT